MPATSEKLPSSLWYAVSLILLILTVVLRLLSYPVMVSDYTYFVSVWFNALATHAGLSAFMQPFSDYAPAYLYLLKGLTPLPFSSLVSEKTLSFLFDILSGYFGYLILKSTSVWKNRRDILFLAFAMLISLPTVVINSSLWGQSDSLYTAGVLGSFYFLLIDMPLYAAILFGVAISFKVQAVFFAPILVGYLLRNRADWKYLLVPLGIYTLLIVPAWIAGGSFWHWFFIYLTQSKEYAYLSVSAQSIFAFFQPLPLSPGATNVLFWIGIVLSLAVVIAIIRIMLKTRDLTAQLLITLSLASALLLPYLLPRMHERYFYLADVLSTLYAFYVPKRWFVPVLVVGTSLLSYLPYLSHQLPSLASFNIDLRIPAAILLILISVVLYDLWRQLKQHMQ